MKQRKIKESFVVEKTKTFLKRKGYTTRQNKRGIDITGYGKGKRSLWIEAKGDSKFHPQGIHNSFVVALGQIMSRMDEKHKNRYYGIAIPSHWESTWKKKIKKMKYAWELLRMKTYLVCPNGHVEVKNCKKMLKD